MRWYAKLSNGDVEAMTLDELDVAYENGVIDANTPVLGPEATEWASLGELACLGESAMTLSPTTHDGNASIPLPPPIRSRSKRKWVAPIAFAAVAATAFAAAGFEAQQAGAFSRRHAPAEEVSLPPRPPVTSTGAPSATLPVELAPHPVAPEAEKRRKRETKGGNSARSTETTVPSSGQAQVFTSGGNRYDPLNTDLP